MKKYLALAGTLLFALMAAAQPPMPSQFTADMNIKSGRGDMTGKYYFGGQKIRMDMNTPRGQMYNIMNMDTQTTDMVIPEQKMYMEMKGMSGRGPMGNAMKSMKNYDPNDPCKGNENHTCKKAGTDTVDGRACDKWEITDKSSGDTSTVCVDQKIHFPLRVQSKDATIEFTNVKEGAPDASVFEVPAGYRKMEGMGGGMGGPRQPQ